MSFDIMRQKFPANILAKAFGFTETNEYFEPETPAARELPKVSF